MIMKIFVCLRSASSYDVCVWTLDKQHYDCKTLSDDFADWLDFHFSSGCFQYHEDSAFISERIPLSDPSASMLWPFIITAKYVFSSLSATLYSATGYMKWPSHRNWV